MEKQGKKVVIFVIISLVTLFTVLSSVIFSMKNFTAYCYNDTDETLATAVSAETANYSRDKSIFMLDESELKERIERKFSNVKVINIERIFPDVVRVNYEKIIEVFAASDGTQWYYLSEKGKILSVDGGAKYGKGEYVRVLGYGERAATQVGSDFFADAEKKSILLAAVNALDKYTSSAKKFIEKIDLSRTDKFELRINTRSGALAQVLFPSSNLESKIRLFVTAFNTCNYAQRTKGVWIIDSFKASHAAKEVE